MWVNEDRVNHTFNSMLLKYFINNAYIMSAVNRSTEMFTETDEHMDAHACVMLSGSMTPD